MSYPRMRDALAKSGRPILFAMCNGGEEDVWSWAAPVGNSWRITGDITNDWKSVASGSACSH